MRTAFPGLSAVLVMLTAAPIMRAEVVHLQDGSQLAGTLDEAAADGSLTVRTLDGPVIVAAENVLLVEGRAALRDTFAKVKRDQGDTAEGQVQLARWALRKGLFDEAVEAGDAALRKSAEADAKLALPPELFRVPIDGVPAQTALDASSAWKLLAACADAKRPARMLIARERLTKGVKATQEDLTPTLLRGLKDASSGVRVASLAAIGAAKPEAGLEPAIGRMLFDKEPRVRKAAIQAVGAYHHEGVIWPLARALAHDNPQLRSNALDALETMQDSRAAGALIKNLGGGAGGGAGGGYTGHRASMSVTHQVSYVQDFDTEVAQAAVIAKPNVNIAQDGVVLDATVLGVTERGISTAERLRVAKLLARITGKDFGLDYDKWSTWWRNR